MTHLEEFLRNNSVLEKSCQFKDSYNFTKINLLGHRKNVIILGIQILLPK